jgi:hypothetical protein
VHVIRLHVLIEGGLCHFTPLFGINYFILCPLDMIALLQWYFPWIILYEGNWHK